MRRAALTLALTVALSGCQQRTISSPSDVECPTGQTWITYAIQGDPSRGDPGDGECGVLYEDGAYLIDGTPGCLPAWPCDNTNEEK